MSAKQGGARWGTQTEDLNATLLVWAPGQGVERHVNEARDVVIVVLGGGGSVEVDGHAHAIRAGQAIVIEKGRERAITAGAAGLRYVSVHQRRDPLQITPSKPVTEARA